MDIFEGREQIQQLVISRGISGLQIKQLASSHGLPNQGGEWGFPVVTDGKPLASLHQVVSLVKAVA